MEKLTATQIGALLSISERTVQRWIKTGKIKATLQANGYYLLDPADFADLQLPMVSTETSTATALADILTRLEAIEYYLHSLEDEIVQLRADVQMRQGTSQHVTHSQPLKISHITQHVSDDRPGDAGGVIWLDGNLVAWRSFCRVHGLSEGTIHKAIEHGRVPVVEGSWRLGKTPYTLALDASGRQKIYQLYHNTPRFIQCPQCPH